MKIKATIACSVLAVVTATAQVPAPKPPAKPAGAAAAPKFKAIWEPVPFNKDINLNAVACVGPETCWAVGDKSTILFTTDGGTKWQVQLGGDPEATDRDLSKVFFLDAKNGWAMTENGKILGTRDGSTWAELSTVSGTSYGLWFLSPQNGFEFENSASGVTAPQRRRRQELGAGEPLQRRRQRRRTAAKTAMPLARGTLSLTDPGVRGRRSNRRAGNVCGHVRHDDRRGTDMDDVGDSGNQTSDHRR